MMGLSSKRSTIVKNPAEFIKGLVTLGQEAVKTLAPAAKAASEPVSGKLIAIY
jgi:hypothetical protein